MMDHRQLLHEKRGEILKLATRYGAHNVRLFGSVARGESTAQSDIDLLVDMDPERSLLDHVALKQDLEDLLHCHIDLVSARALHHTIRDKVLREAVAL